MFNDTIELHPLGHERGDDPCPVVDGRRVQVGAVVLHAVPDGRERRRDDVEHGDAARHEGHVVILDVGARELGGPLAAVGEEGPLGVGLELVQRPHPRLDLRHPLVRPVRRLEVRGHARVRGPEQVEQHEELDRVERVLVGRERRVQLRFPSFGECPASVVSSR